MVEGLVLLVPYLALALFFTFWMLTLAIRQQREFGRFRERLFTTNDSMAMGHVSRPGESVGLTEGELDPKIGPNHPDPRQRLADREAS